jgi:phosphoglycerate dehydrogenase-like enzyme
VVAPEDEECSISAVMSSEKNARSLPKATVLNPNPEPVVERIRARFPDLPLSVCDSYDAMAETIARERPEVALAFKIGQGAFPREAVLGADSVKWIQASGAGIDHWTPWDPGRVKLTNASGIHGDVMAGYVVWAILNHHFRFPALARQQAAREWNKRLLVPISGLTLVIIGFGRIGAEVGRLAKSLGMRVIGVRAHPKPSPMADQVVGLDGLRAALESADFVLNVLPLTNDTRGLIGADVFAAMKDGAYFINTGRGKIVDEDALAAALESGRLSGATLDVFATEPLPPESPFWEMPNVVVTPHASGDAFDWELRVADLFCDNLERWVSGEPLQNIVDPASGY